MAKQIEILAHVIDNQKKLHITTFSIDADKVFFLSKNGILISLLFAENGIAQTIKKKFPSFWNFNIFVRPNSYYFIARERVTYFWQNIESLKQIQIQYLLDDHEISQIKNYSGKYVQLPYMRLY